MRYPVSSLPKQRKAVLTYAKSSRSLTTSHQKHRRHSSTERAPETRNLQHSSSLSRRDSPSDFQSRVVKSHCPKSQTPTLSQTAYSGSPEDLRILRSPCEKINGNECDPPITHLGLSRSFLAYRLVLSGTLLAPQSPPVPLLEQHVW